MKYRVCEMYETVQGEGALAGTPVTLIRLQGCSVGCSWCDTKHSWSESDGEWMTPSEIADRWKVIRCKSDWILLTGGEPAEQPLKELVELLTDFGASLMVETSGTASGLLDCHELIEHITLSPKQHKLPTDLNIAIADELKLVVADERDVLFWREYLQRREVSRRRRRGLPISVQPDFGARPESTKVAVRASRDNNWRLSFQIHKYLGLR
jgi:7-carboxy-7-deazaguanine synthase